MSLFQFTALRQSGEKFSDVREAKDKYALIEMLRAEGATALQVEPTKSRHVQNGQSVFSMTFTLPFISPVPNNEKILFARNLSALIAAGLALSRALSVLEKQTRQAYMKKTLHELGDDIKQGTSLHDALSRHPRVFSMLMVAMARAGEESGTLSESLQVVALQMERAYLLTKKIRGAMIYPTIVVIVMIAIFVLMLIFVVPTLASTFESLNTQLPLPTQIILGLSNAIVAHAILISAAAILGIVGIISAARTSLGRRTIDLVVLKLPVIGTIVAKANAARTARTLSSLLSSGVSALASLEITADVVRNTQFRPVILRAHEAVEKGKPMSEMFVEAEKIYPIMFAEMAAVGEETGDLSGMLTRVADFYESEVENATKDLSTIIEPILMVVIGAGVGFFAIAMIMPIYSLSSSI